MYVLLTIMSRLDDSLVGIIKQKWLLIMAKSVWFYLCLTHCKSLQIQ